MSESTSSGGLGLFSVLGIVFIVLKLVGTIDWSWWLVLLPFYGPWVALILFVVVCSAFEDGVWR